MALQRSWKLRNTLAEALDQALDAVAGDVTAASDEELVAFIDGFIPGASPSAEWSASLERFIEFLWATAPDRIEALHGVYAARPALQWGGLTNLLSPDAGDRARTRFFKPPLAKRVAVVLR
jgi:hypothetical protein